MGKTSQQNSLKDIVCFLYTHMKAGSICHAHRKRFPQNKFKNINYKKIFLVVSKTSSNGTTTISLEKISKAKVQHPAF